MKSQELREKFIKFFEERGHKEISSFSLVPENDITTLFTGSGMQQLIPYLLGEKHPEGKRLVNSQKCIRVDDIAEVGDNRHTTFFEMLGNWSLGDYFKKEQLGWIFTFLTEEIKIDPKRLYITVFAGDSKAVIEKDKESVKIWKKLFEAKKIDAKDVFLGTESNGYRLGMQGGRIFYYDSSKNWWSRTGAPENMPAGELGGPDSEIFYEFTSVKHDRKYGDNCHPNCDCGRFLEIGNSVFMEYKKLDDGTFSCLPQKNVDFGGGLERMSAAVNDNPDIFSIDIFKPTISKLEKITGKKYKNEVLAMRRIADHSRAAIKLIQEGVFPGKNERNYVSRVLLRVTFVEIGHLMGRNNISHNNIEDALAAMFEDFSTIVSEIYKNAGSEILDIVLGEYSKYLALKKNGIAYINKYKHLSIITGEIIFKGKDTFGLSPDGIVDLWKIGKKVDLNWRVNYQEAFKKHQEISKKGAEKKFKGGLETGGEQETKFHTATHLMYRALQMVLGDHVKQAGANITSERIRFDFTHPEKMTAEQVEEVEKIVNKQIESSISVELEEMSLVEAKKQGASGIFDSKYGDVVKVYTIGDFSKEICGGPHVKNTSELGVFKIKKEESSSAGVRRIKAILE